MDVLKASLQPSQVDYGSQEHARELRSTLGKIESQSASTSQDLPQDVTLRLLATASDIDQKMRDTILLEHIFESLSYPDISSRHEMIPKAHQETFHWAFRKPREHHSNHDWADFGEWLQGSDPIYWIAGKPGAGKSTLMKYLFHHSRTEELIQHWRESSGLGPGAISKAGFFFWNSGSEMQMSRVGLGRTILAQLWKDFSPEKVAELFPTRWKRCQILGQDNEPYTWEELSPALDMVLSDPRRVFLLFIDGLDEFDGSKHLLADYVLHLSSKPNVKICAASRPWVEFQSKFDGRPGLLIENLTRRDIIKYVDARFAGSREFQNMQRHDEALATNLKGSIVKKASGVFLWVYVVINTLLDGLVSGDRLEQLRETLDALPPELNDLFDRIIQQLEPKHAPEASELFQFVRQQAHVADSTLIGLYWSRLTLEEVLQAPIVAMSLEEAKYRAELMQRNVVSRCKCLLEVGGPPEAITPVTWAHRTVREYLQRSEVWNKILALSPKYDPEKALCLSRLRQAKASMTSRGCEVNDAEQALQDAFSKTEVFKLPQERIAFVRDAEKVGISLAARQGPVPKNRNNVYWIEAEGLYELCDEGVPIAMSGRTTAFHAAMALGWEWLVRERIAEDPSVLEIPASTESHIDALVLASVNEWHHMQLICLQNGARPLKVSPKDHDGRISETTAWEIFLKDKKKAVWLTAEYLRRGADPRVGNAQSVITALLQHARIMEEEDDEDIHILKKSIRKHREWSDQRWRPYRRH